MKAHIQWLTFYIGVLRVGPKFKQYGDMFEASCTIERSGEGRAKILGFTAVKDALDRDMIRAIGFALAENGISKVEFERMKGKLVLKKEISTI